jgi:signal transduction histidine kinase
MSSKADDSDDDERSKFTVDTHLFRELGELLVGRDSTALIELVKNAYDADATEVTVFGEKLSDGRQGLITIADNGVGMDPDTFSRGFLRVAARIKSEGSRKSSRFKRRFTGAKGIGRLAAHKLAKHLKVQSIPWTDSRSAVGVDGFIDWDKVEAVETLDKIKADAVGATELPLKRGDRHGTILTLSRLRKKWTDKQRTRFLLEVEALQAPLALTKPIAKGIVPEAGLFDSPTVTDATTAPFVLKLEGDFEVGDNYWPAVLDAAHWMLEIDASSRSVRYAISPTRRKIRETPYAKAHRFTEPHPNADSGPFFHARLFLREGTTAGNAEERTWSSRVAGVRVYMEGFRVLPYGEEADDWLYLSRDYNSRDRSLRFLSDSGLADKLEQLQQEGLSHLSSKHFFGGVFLTVNKSSSLEMLVNREGFVPDASYELVVKVVRTGIDLMTRVRAGVTARVKAEAPPPRTVAAGSAEAPDRGAEQSEATGAAYHRLEEQKAELERIAADAPPILRKQIAKAASEIGQATAEVRASLPETTMVLVLASVGTQLAAFTHEVSRLLGLASELEVSVSRLRDQDLPLKLKNQVSKVAGSASDLRRAIERQAAYLVDIVTPDARRRRSRLKVYDTINATWKLVETSAAQRGIVLKNDVEPDLKTAPMFRAELMAVFSNLFTNAVKAAGKNGVVRVTANLAEDNVLRIRIENTGTEVDPAKGEKWFRPFESTTVHADPVLGQGMGLGLGITRNILAEMGTTIAFVRARRGFAASIEIVMPGAST